MTKPDRFADSQTEEGRYRLLIEGIRDYAVYMLDPEGRITSWNPGAERLKGYEAVDVIGTSFARFYPEADQKAGQPARNLEIARTEGRFEGEGWRDGKGGRRFWAHVVIDAITDPDGHHVGFAKITRDLTERREAQLALEKARESLFQAQKMEAVGQLTGGIAHDFNNLLMAILGSLELVRKRQAYDPRISPLLENAIQGAQRGSKLTQRMLAFARRQDLKMEAVDIAAQVRGMTELLQRSLGPTLNIETRFPAALSPAWTDANQLETALLNLALNARDAMPAGGPIVIAADEQALGETNAHGLPAGRYICLTVTDHGEGMDAPTLARAMDPFFTTKGVGKGTGLGLPMVHGLAEQSGGRLVLESQLGEGTTAAVWIPVAVDQTAEMATAVGGQDAAAPLEDQLTVLAVDDDALVLMNTVAMLEDSGHTVHEAYSAQDALTILKRESRIDVVVTDQAMPQMTGLQLAEAIGAQWPDMPVVIATGYAELPPHARQFPRIGKPFTQRELVDAVVSAVQTGPVASTDGADAAPPPA